MMPKNTLSDDYVEKRTVVIAESGCWIWMLSTVRGGYGKVSIDGKSHTAHRAIWEKKNGPVPSGLILCHRCDTPSCVNPDHLFVGTHSDNSLDMVTKNRAAKGEKIGNSKLTSDVVGKIRSMTGTYKSIGEAFGISESAVWYVRNNVTWRHIA